MTWWPLGAVLHISSGGGVVLSRPESSSVLTYESVVWLASVSLRWILAEGGMLGLV
jgi:hypothetical protein